jgi:hypothetical protein
MAPEVWRTAGEALQYVGMAGDIGVVFIPDKRASLIKLVAVACGVLFLIGVFSENHGEIAKIWLDRYRCLVTYRYQRRGIV